MPKEPWTGSLLKNVDELTAFDAMRAFLEDYWKRGLRSDDGIAMLISNLDRSVWDDGGPSDPAMWLDWREAVEKILQSGGSAASDPLKPKRAE